jgi:4-amino-4-deoxy-L-arabinose transferase-like glycosyltransferase
MSWSALFASGPDTKRAPMRAVARLFDALTDPLRRERTAVVCIIGFVAVWTLYAVIAKGSQDVHQDVGELVGWSREPGLGYNHPPLATWIVTLWFTVFPRADWAAHLLATTNAGVTLWICWKLFGDWLDETKRVVALAMLALVPLYTFQALVYNANSVMMPVWAAATLFFLRAWRDRRPADAALAGACAGASMLAKYWSVNLVIALVLAPLLTPGRWRFLRSAVPWIAAGAGLLVLAPHLAWIASGGSSTFDFAQDTLGVGASAVPKSARYVLGAVAYVAAPIVIMVLLWPSGSAVRDMLLPEAPERRLMLLVLVVALVLPAVVNLARPVRLTPIWTIPNWSLLPVVLLASPMVAVPREAALRILATALALPIAAVIVSPVVALTTHHLGRADDHTRYRLIADAIAATWRSATAQPLRLIGGARGPDSLNGPVFYLADAVPVDVFNPSFAPWIARERIATQGIALICPVEQKSCIDEIDRIDQARTAIRREVTLARSHFGIRGRTVRYLIAAVPPAG